MPGFRNGAVSSSYVQLALQSDGGIGNKISKLYTPWFHGDNFKSYLTCFSIINVDVGKSVGQKKRA